MSDKVELYVNKMRVDKFLSYRIDADLYTPADAFSLELANPDAPVTPGHLCELRINGATELTGIVDKVTRRVSKSGTSLAVEGRDLMGLLVDFYCEPAHWKTVEGMKLKALAEMLLANVPFIQRQNIVYQENIVGSIKSKRSSSAASICDVLDTAQRLGQIEPGMTIFEVLKSFALSRGMLFYCEPSGALVFGRPPVSGAPEYSLTLSKSGLGNNVIESDVTHDISRRYSKVIVVGQRQGYDDDTSAAAVNMTASREDAAFPFYKLYVTKECNDNVSPAMRARLIMEQQRREGEQMTYTVGRHSQAGKNWRFGAFCHVADEKQEIDGDYLIYGRTFELRKETGAITRLRLGVPGLVA
jgi:prophage tail gpP-like protein